MTAASLTPARDPATELVAASQAGEPLREVDLHIARIIALMIAGEWPRGRGADLYAETWGIPLSRVNNWAAEAARHLRLCQTPSAVRAKALVHLDRIVEENDRDRVPALKVMLDTISATGPGSSGQAVARPEEQMERLAALFADPPPELVQLLEANGWERRR